MIRKKNFNANPIIVRNSMLQWSISFVIYASLFMLMLEYHRWRGKPYSLFTINKAIAIASSLLLSFSLALGPLCRLTGKVNKAIRLRRTLGITGVIFILLHILLSLFFVEKFDFSYYCKNWFSTIFGIAALIGFLLLWATSYKYALKQLGQNRWKHIQTSGYLFLTFAILHIVMLNKIPNWILWFKTFNQPVPPGTIIPSVIATVVILLKIADMTLMKEELGK